jgi:hypothetical protein
VPVQRKQHATEHDRPIRVERGTERGHQVIGGARRVTITPDRHGGACPVQVAGFLVSVSHGWPPVMIIFSLVPPAIAGVTSSQDLAGA